MAAPQREYAAIRDIAVKRPITVDDLSDVRHLHRIAFHRLADRRHAADLTDAYNAYLYLPAFASGVLNADIMGLWLDRALIATAGWEPTDEKSPPTARIVHVAVSPLFNGLGLGRHIVNDAERRASDARFAHFTARATAKSVPFFERLGYSITSRGVTTLAHDAELPITYMRRN